MRKGDSVSFVRSVTEGKLNDNKIIKNGKVVVFSIRGKFERWGQTYLDEEGKIIPLTVAIVKYDDTFYLVPPDHLALGYK